MKNDIRGRPDEYARTYVVLRPRYEIGDPFDTTTIVQKDIRYIRSKSASIPRLDPKTDFKGRFEYDRHGRIKIKRLERIKRPGDIKRIERETELTLPNIRRLHGVPPKPALLRSFGHYAYDYEVKIGVDPEAVHESFSGHSVSYEGLFALLDHYGYDPLAPLRDAETVERFERRLGALIYSEVQSAIKSGKKKNMNHVISSWALNPRDYVRDYIRGGISVKKGKKPLEDSTILTRRSKQKHGATYRYGLANALWETGALESAISVLEVMATARLTSQKNWIERRKSAEESRRRARGIRRDAPDVPAMTYEEALIELKSKARHAAQELYRKDRGVHFKIESGDRYKWQGNDASQWKFNQRMLQKNHPAEFDAFVNAYRDATVPERIAKAIASIMAKRG